MLAPVTTYRLKWLFSFGAAMFLALCSFSDFAWNTPSEKMWGIGFWLCVTGFGWASVVHYRSTRRVTGEPKTPR